MVPSNLEHRGSERDPNRCSPFHTVEMVLCMLPQLPHGLRLDQRLATSGLDVYAHNVETVRRLQPYVRDKRAGYDQSLTVLARAKATGAGSGVYTKSSLMLGLGETEDEVLEVRVLLVFFCSVHLFIPRVFAGGYSCTDCCQIPVQLLGLSILHLAASPVKFVLISVTDDRPPIMLVTMAPGRRCGICGRQE